MDFANIQNELASVGADTTTIRRMVRDLTPARLLFPCRRFSQAEVQIDSCFERVVRLGSELMQRALPSDLNSRLYVAAEFLVVAETYRSVDCLVHLTDRDIGDIKNRRDVLIGLLVALLSLVVAIVALVSGVVS